MASTTNDYRLTNVTTEKTNALNNLNNTYNNMVNNSQKYYDDLINNSKDWTNKQQAIQQANTNWAVDKIEQSKEQAEKDYIKEQKGAYTDYQKAIDEYGVNAEQRASTGMNNSGYTETAQMMAFNSYQNRYASAREDYNKAILNYDNSIKDAMLQNSSSLAQIAYEGLQSQLELALQGFQYKNELLQNQISSQMQMESLYETKYNNVLNQINEENRLAEERRQFNAQLAENRRQFNASQAAKEKEESIPLDGTITTAYYHGQINPDAKNGTFSNGYQPDNVNGKKLSKTGKTIKVKSKTLQGTETTTVQNIWKTSDGTKYVWDGTKNVYVKY